MEACQGTSDGGWSRPGGWARGAAGGCRGHHYMLSPLIIVIDKFALLWGEAQKKIAYSYLKVT